MKKIKVIALIMVLACIVCAFAGCGSAKWDDIKNKDVVATVNGTEITKQHVMYFYAENVASAEVASSMFQQMGIEEVEEETEIETSFREALAYYVVGELARENGYGLTEDEAYEKAYQEYVLMEKKPGYEYIAEYNAQIREMLYFDSEMMVEYASAKIYNSVPSMDYIEALMEEMQYDYPKDPETKDDNLKAAVAERLAKDAKKLDIKLNYHSKKTIDKIAFDEIVTRGATTFVRAD